jgi:transcriptional regulator GlxA family with amidase domain
MKHISILVPEGDCSLTHIEATHQILLQVNTFLQSMDKPPLLTIQLVGLHNEPRIKKGLFTIYPDVLMKDVSKTDLIIIPAIQGDMTKALELNQPFIPWLIKQYTNGAEIASFCIGSFLLAATGLLDGKHCTTHWSASTDFRTMFPDAMLVPDKIITDDRGIYCSGGALSFQNLIVYLIEKYAGREMAILTSKTFMIDIDRDSQSPFIIFKGQKEHDDESISKAQEFIEKNFGEKISVEQLSSMVAVSRRNLERRFKKATSNSIIEYVQRVRIEAAKKSLESSRLNVNEVMYNVGYTDMKAFRTTFKKITGLSPIEYRNKYNPRLVVSEE